MIVCAGQQGRHRHKNRLLDTVGEGEGGIFCKTALKHTYCTHAKLCLTLCDTIDCSPPGSSLHGHFPGESTGVNCHALLQGIFLTHRSNPCLLCLLPWQADFLYHQLHLAGETYTLPQVKQIPSGSLLYDPGNPKLVLCSVTIQRAGTGRKKGGRCKREGTYVYLWSIHVDVW